MAPCPRRRFCRQKAGLETRSALFSPRSATEPDVAFSPAFGGSSGSEPGIERVNYSAGGPLSEPAAAAAASLCSRMRRSEVAPISFLLFDPKPFVMSFFPRLFLFLCAYFYWLCIFFPIGYPFFYRRESALYLALSLSLSPPVTFRRWVVSISLASWTFLQSGSLLAIFICFY